MYCIVLFSVELLEPHIVLYFIFVYCLIWDPRNALHCIALFPLHYGTQGMYGIVLFSIELLDPEIVLYCIVFYCILLNSIVFKGCPRMRVLLLHNLRPLRHLSLWAPPTMAPIRDRRVTGGKTVDLHLWPCIPVFPSRRKIALPWRRRLTSVTVTTTRVWRMKVSPSPTSPG